MSKPIPIKDRIIGYLQHTRPVATFYDLMPLGPTASVNTALAALLEAGVLEAVEVGEGVGVRLAPQQDTPESS